MTLRQFATILATLAAGTASAQDDATAKATEAAVQTATLPAITAIEVMDAEIHDRVYASGQIGPVEEVVVQPQIEGQAIDALLADVGDTVTKGEGLATLSQSSLLLMRTQLDASRSSAVAALAQGKAQLTDAQSAASEARSVLDRTKSLQKSGNVSQAQADTALSNSASADARVTAAAQGVEAAQAGIALADARRADVDLSIARTTVTASVGGLIAARNASLGAIASASGKPMFVIVRDGLLELRADVAERDILRLQVGQTVEMRVVGLAEPVTGKIRLVEPTVDAVTRLGRVRIALDDPGSVRSGMFAEAAILVAERRVPVVPDTAVEVGEDGTSLLTVGTDGTLTRVSVVTGIRENGFVEIKSGVAAGDTVVARAGAFVRAGDRINPILDSAAQPNE